MLIPELNNLLTEEERNCEVSWEAAGRHIEMLRQRLAEERRENRRLANQRAEMEAANHAE